MAKKEQRITQYPTLCSM